LQHERQLRFLLNRGFSLAIALKVLRAAGANEE
jgi:SOS response regulatory protein OraA/RecX